MNEHQYTISGMTCENCRRHVTEALASLPGARDVSVDLASGRAIVRSDRRLPEDAVRAALDEAGYSLG